MCRRGGGYTDRRITYTRARTHTHLGVPPAHHWLCRNLGSAAARANLHQALPQTVWPVRGNPALDAGGGGVMWRPQALHRGAGEPRASLARWWPEAHARPPRLLPLSGGGARRGCPLHVPMWAVLKTTCVWRAWAWPAGSSCGLAGSGTPTRARASRTQQHGVANYGPTTAAASRLPRAPGAARFRSPADPAAAWPRPALPEAACSRSTVARRSRTELSRSRP